MQDAHYAFPTEIHLGIGARNLLPAKLKSLRIQRPLLVTDRGLSNLNWLEKLEARIPSGYPLKRFDGVGGNPTEDQVLQGLQAYQEHRADGLIAVGGGAPMDVAKAIALLVSHRPPLSQYRDGDPAALPIDGEVPAIIALPTTAGTGSEVGRSSVIGDSRSKVKNIYFSPKLLPQVVLADPELLLTLPATLTASTGVDALTHLLEAFLSPVNHPLCDGIALEGVRLVSQSLLPSIHLAQANVGSTQEHLQARQDMLNASMMGAIAFQKGLGVCHSCAHALSTVLDLHHGLANSLMLLPSMRLNQEAVPERFDRLAQAAGVLDLLQWIDSLLSQSGLPRTLLEVGMNESHLPELVRHAYADTCHHSNPRPINPQILEDLFRSAMKESLPHA